VTCRDENVSFYALPRPELLLALPTLGVPVDLEKLRIDHEAVLRQVAWRLTRDSKTAEDCVQDVWVRVATTTTRPEQGKESEWLKQILRNCVNDWFRKDGRIGLINSSDIQSTDSDDASLIDQVADNNSESPLDRLEKTESLRDCLRKLDGKYRTVLILFYFEHQSYEQIAESIQSPKKTVGSRANRGREMIKNCMEKKGWS
jgi:RNA polymerase sigma-70 factor (ECF subfamily)